MNTRLLLTRSFLSLSALAVSLAATSVGCGSTTESDESCGGARPACAECATGGETAHGPVCSGGSWSCSVVVCGDVDAGHVDAGGCETDPPTTCMGCDGETVAAQCNGGSWQCPELGCPVQPIDSGVDSGPADAGPHGDASADGGSDAGDSGPDSGPDSGAGDDCTVGAACDDGMSCSVVSGGQTVASCTCSQGAYVCH